MSIRSVSDEAGVHPFDLRKQRRQKLASLGATALDRQPPHDLEMEMGVLGCCMLSPNECMDEVILKAGERKEMFYDLRHQAIYSALLHLRMANQPIDLKTVYLHMKDEKVLEQVGGIAYLSQIQDGIPSAANLSWYLEKTVEKFLLRSAVEVCTGVVGRIYGYEGEVDQLLSAMEHEVLNIRQMFTRGRGRVNVTDIQLKLIQMYEDAFNHKQVAGLLTKFHDWNKKLGGFMGQELIIIGGTPSSGKTTLAMNIAYGLAEAGNRVSMKSFETSATKLVHRFNCMAGQINSTGFLRGDITEEDFLRMQAAIGKVNGVRENLMISDQAMTDTELVASCRQDYAAGARMLVVDMLQNIQVPKADGEYERVTIACQTVKRIAKDLDVPVILTSALNRVEPGKKPTMANLRQSGQIESDADKIILLHCDKRDEDVREVDGDVVKNKDGPLGTIPFTFFSSQFRFESAAPPVEEGAPRQHPD